MKRCIVSRPGLAVLLALALSGCLFSSDPDDPPPPVVRLPFADSEDQAIANFKTAYTGLNLDDYRTVLHPGYVFRFRAEDVLPGGSDSLTCAEEFAVAGRLFSGLPYERPGDVTVPAISAIAIARFERLGDWSDVEAGAPEFPQTRRALYDIQIAFQRPNATTIIVTGQQLFFVSARDSLVGGVLQPYYRVRGQRDLSGGIKTDTDSWGRVKQVYR